MQKFSTTMNNNSLPPEVWSQIFWHACVDTGYTGCSISETCRFFHNIGKPTQYRSVALRGLSQVISFWNSIKSLPSHHLQIESMYILVKNDDDDIDAAESHQLQISAIDDDTVYRMPSYTLIRVLTAAAPSLRYLYLCCKMKRRTLFLPVEFPLLTELVIHGEYGDYDHTTTGSLPTLLNLRKLRISNTSFYGDRAFSVIPIYAPYLTHLRLDRHTAYSTSFVSALRGILQLSSEPSAYRDDGSSPVDVKFPASLKRVLIALGRPNHSLVGYPAAFARRRAQLALRPLVESDPRIFLEERVRPDFQLGSLVEWMDRINGKMAYWNNCAN